MFDLLDMAKEMKQNVSINGHQFAYHLLDLGEQFDASLLMAPYSETPALDLVAKTATFALSIDSIDGRPLYEPVLASNADLSREKFKQACRISSWWIETWFKEYSKKHEEYNRRLEDLKKK